MILCSICRIIVDVLLLFSPHTLYLHLMISSGSCTLPIASLYLQTGLRRIICRISVRLLQHFLSKSFSSPINVKSILEAGCEARSVDLCGSSPQVTQPAMSATSNSQNDFLPLPPPLTIRFYTIDPCFCGTSAPPHPTPSRVRT